MRHLIIKVPAVLGLHSTKGPWIVKSREKLFYSKDVTIYNSNHPTNNMVHISDLVKFIIKVIDENTVCNESVVLGTYDFLTIEQVVLHMKKLMHSSSRILYGATEKPNYYIDMEKAKALGYESMPQRTLLERFCKEYLDFMNNKKHIK